MSVLPRRVTPVAALDSVTRTSPIGAPASLVTVPLKPPVVMPCPAASDPARKTTTTQSQMSSFAPLDFVNVKLEPQYSGLLQRFPAVDAQVWCPNLTNCGD